MIVLYCINMSVHGDFQYLAGLTSGGPAQCHFLRICIVKSQVHISVSSTISAAIAVKMRSRIGCVMWKYTDILNLNNHVLD